MSGNWFRPHSPPLEGHFYCFAAVWRHLKLNEIFTIMVCCFSNIVDFPLFIHIHIYSIRHVVRAGGIPQCGNVPHYGQIAANHANIPYCTHKCCASDRMNEWRHSQSNTHTHTDGHTHTLLVCPCLPLLSAFCECAKSAIYECFDCKSSWPKPRFVIIFKSFLFVLPTGSGAEKTYDAYDMQSVCRARRARLDGIRFYG